MFYDDFNIKKKNLLQNLYKKKNVKLFLIFLLNSNDI